MQNRAVARVVANDSDNKVGNLGPEKSYSFIDAIRVAFDVGALGLGVNGDISRNSSLLTAITVEGFCSALSLIVAVHEIVNVCRQQCFRPDGLTVDSTSHPVTEYSTYLSFRMASIASSMVGMSLMASDLAVETTTAKSTVGIVMVSIGIFASRALSGSRHKPAEAVLRRYIDNDDIDMGLLVPVQDDPPPPAPAGQPAPEPMQAIHEEVPLVVDAQPVRNMAPAQARQQNQFFQPGPAPVGPPAQRHAVPRKKVRKKVARVGHK